MCECVTIPACGCVDIELVRAGVGLGREGSGVGDAAHSSVFCVFCSSFLSVSMCVRVGVRVRVCVCACQCACVCGRFSKL